MHRTTQQTKTGRGRRARAEWELEAGGSATLELRF